MSFSAVNSTPPNLSAASEVPVEDREREGQGRMGQDRKRNKKDERNERTQLTTLISGFRSHHKPFHSTLENTHRTKTWESKHKAKQLAWRWESKTNATNQTNSASTNLTNNEASVYRAVAAAIVLLGRVKLLSKKECFSCLLQQNVTWRLPEWSALWSR